MVFVKEWMKVSVQGTISSSAKTPDGYVEVNDVCNTFAQNLLHPSIAQLEERKTVMGYPHVSRDQILMSLVRSRLEGAILSFFPRIFCALERLQESKLSELKTVKRRKSRRLSERGYCWLLIWITTRT